jgi:uncharacterized protein YdaT
MAYTKKTYPVSMKNLDSEIREKAIDILNAIIDDTDMERGMAIATAISRAKDWAANRNKPLVSTPTDKKKHGEDVYVIPRKSGWAIKKEKSDTTSNTYNKKVEAIKHARNLARKNNGSLTIQRKDGTIQTRISYNKASL